MFGFHLEISNEFIFVFTMAQCSLNVISIEISAKKCMIKNRIEWKMVENMMHNAKKFQKIKTEKHLRMDEDEDEIYIESNRTNVLHIIYLTLLSI